MAINDPPLNSYLINNIVPMLMDITRKPVNDIKETLDSLRTNEQRIKDIAAVLRCEPEQIIPRIIKQMDEANDLREEIARLQKSLDPDLI